MIEFYGQELEILKDELKVSEIVFRPIIECDVILRVLPNLKILGKKYRGKLPQIQRAMCFVSAAEVVENNAQGRTTTLNLGTESIELEPNEIIIKAPRSSAGFATDGEIVVKFEQDKMIVYS